MEAEWSIFQKEMQSEITLSRCPFIPLNFLLPESLHHLVPSALLSFLSYCTLNDTYLLIMFVSSFQLGKKLIWKLLVERINIPFYICNTPLSVVHNSMPLSEYLKIHNKPNKYFFYDILSPFSQLFCLILILSSLQIIILRCILLLNLTFKGLHEMVLNKMYPFSIS